MLREDLEMRKGLNAYAPYRLIVILFFRHNQTENIFLRMNYLESDINQILKRETNLGNTCKEKEGMTIILSIFSINLFLYKSVYQSVLG